MQNIQFDTLPHAAERHQHLALLLKADPSEKQINGYINLGEMFIARHGARVVGVIAIVPVSDTTGEIKNLAVETDCRKQGLGRQLIEHAIKHTKHRYNRLMVGTSDSGVPFYERCGFIYSHRVPDFFIKHYPEPLFEGGKQCIDMLYLQKRWDRALLSVLAATG